MRYFLILLSFLISQGLYAQYTMTNSTVYDCEGTLTDSEANAINSGWYDHNESYLFTICPNGALSITINFTFFETEPTNDYVVIYDGPDNTYPVIGGPYSGMNLPPQITSSGCVTIGFVSDINVAAEGFELTWTSDVSIPSPPVISLPSTPICSTNILTIELDQNIHCDSVYTAQISIGGQLNQIISPTPINCTNDSTNTIQLNLLPGLNESGSYSIYFQSFFKDDCDSIWDLSTSYQFAINDCPLQVNINASPDSVICQGDCVDLYVNVSGGDPTSYTYTWVPALPNSPGPHNVCPSSNTLYSVTVSDAGPAAPQTDNILITVLSPPITQPDFSVCQTDPPLNLVANPAGGLWSGNGIINTNPGIFYADGLAAGVYTVSYGFGGCSDDLNISILEINAGPDISTCVNTPTFNLNSVFTTPGGVWSGCSCIQSNGDITVGAIPTTINAIYTLPNSCSDTLVVSVVNNITMPAGTTLCQQLGTFPLLPNPINGTWSVLPDNPQIASNCLNAIVTFPYQEGWENGLNGWTHDVGNDFDWILNSGGTPSGNTGPGSAYEGFDYIYTEASNPNFPGKRAAIISPCLNLSEYDNPVLHFWYHKYGSGQGSLAVDISIDNGLTWVLNHWDVYGDFGNQWNEIDIDLSAFNSTEVLIRLRVVTGNAYSSDVAIDKLSILGGPVTADGSFLTDVAIAGVHNLVYSIEGCNDFVDILVNEIDAGPDQITCPLQNPFNLISSPNGGVWSGNNIIDVNTGLFDPSLSLGIDTVTYSFNGCIDTAEIIVVDTDVQIDSLFFCINEGIQQLDLGLVPRTPWNGNWSGNGIISVNNPGEFSPNIAGSGVHTITYEANTCTDNIFIKVHPKSFLYDTLICLSSSDLILNVNPSGGTWIGNGIVNSNTGLFSPSQVGIGTHMIGYIAPSGCVDTFAITVYNSPTLSLLGLDTDYCFKDTNIQVMVSPSGGVLSGNGINGFTFNPSLAGSGYHNIVYSYGSGVCLQTIDIVVFVSEELITNTYYTEDTICVGDMIKIGVNASGGTMNYSFVWNNGLGGSFEHLVAPTVTTNYMLTTYDGCSTPVRDTISIYLHPTFSIGFSTSTKQCYGTEGFAHVEVTPPSSNYTYLWNTSPPINSDSIFALVDKNYQVEVKDNVTTCSVVDTITIPGYSNIIANFFSSNTECISVIDAEFQFNDNSVVNPAELSVSSNWHFGDGEIAPYVFSENPTHQYADTGVYLVELYLENIGGCKDSITRSVCINPDMKLYIPNSFTPNGDKCNDEFYIKGVGDFYSFDIKIHKRWGSEVVFESNEIIVTNHIDDGNICNSITDNSSYYKMGSWDGVMLDGFDAPQGMYTYVVNYMHTKDSDTVTRLGFVILIR